MRIARLMPATSPPEDSVVGCLDGVGPEGEKSFPGTGVIDPAPAAGRPAGRARQAADYGRRGKGYIFGAVRPATVEAFTHPYLGCTTSNWADFPERVGGWGSASFVPGLGKSTTSAYQAAINKLAIQIVSMMEKPW